MWQDRMPLVLLVTRIVLLLAFTGSVQTQSSDRNVYYVKPTADDTRCPNNGSLCLTLTEYAQGAEQYFNTTSILIFFPGNHMLEVDFAITNVTSIVLIGDSAADTSIVCTAPVSLTFSNIYSVKIDALQLISCGKNQLITSFGAITLSSVELFELSRCRLENNRYTSAISSSYSNLSLTQNVFRGNNASVSGAGGGVQAVYSNLTLTQNTFRNNTARFRGGGVYVLYSSLTLTMNVFDSNSAWDDGGGVFADSSSLMSSGDTFKNNTASNGGGGGIMLTLASSLSLNLSVFENNHAANGGAVQVDRCSSMILSGNIFESNRAFEDGGGMVVQGCDRIILTENVFANNTASDDEGGLSVSSCRGVCSDNVFAGNSASETTGGMGIEDSEIVFRGNTVFRNNSARFAGGGLTVVASNVTFNGTSTFMGNFGGYGGGGILSLSSNLNFTGNCTISENHAEYGGGVTAVQSNLLLSEYTSLRSNTAEVGGGIFATSMCSLTFQGTSNFLNNSARNGGGISLAGASTCYFQPSTNIHFVSNYATEHGGAINVDDSNLLLYCLPQTEALQNHTDLGECFFQLPVILEAMNSYVKLVFENNTALEAGSALYGGVIDSCVLTTSVNEDNNGGAVFDSISEVEYSPSSISSDPLHICVCDSENKMNCNITSVHRQVKPGGTFSISVVATGQRFGTVPAVIQSSFDSQSTTTLGEFENAQPANNTCTTLRYTTFSQETGIFENLTLNIRAVCPTSLLVQLEILDCPDGFELSSGACNCEKRLQRYTNSCNINSETIERDGDFWVGFDQKKLQLILHPNCPLDYCTTEKVSFTVDEADKQCNYERSGFLCGSCRHGLSLVLGSSQCKTCSNDYLALLIPFVFAGFALVALLLLCKLTVAVGTINGLIFYANVITQNQDIFFQQGERNILTGFIAWLNLDLGIETCFYDGMDAYARTWLQFLFPAYIWALMGLMILASSFSRRISKALGTNPVAVLATLFLFSYAKLLRTMIAATFSYTTLEYPTDKTENVWLYDGNVPYLSGKHIALFVAGLLVFLFLFLPYTLLLVSYQWLLAMSHHRILSWVNSPRLKVFMDAYHAPFKPNHRYWPGLLLLVRFVLLLTFGLNALSDPSINLLAIITGTLTLATWAWAVEGVYQHTYLNVLEGFFILNLGILAAATYHIKLSGGSHASAANTLMGLAFTVFVGILVYHIYLQIKDTKLGKIIPKYNFQQFMHRKQRVSKSDEVSLENTNSTPTTSYIDFREILLDDN